MEIKGKKILIISPEPWGINHVSKHHYALVLSQYNDVYFLNPPNKASSFFIEKIFDCLHVIHYKNRIRGINKLPAAIRETIDKKRIGNILKKLNTHIDIVWSFDPFRFQNLTFFEASTKIYHAVDHHDTGAEKMICETADVVFTSSALLMEKLLRFNPRSNNISHGLANHFINARNPPNQNLPGNFSMKIGYVGNLTFKYLDKATLLVLVRTFPNIGFYFIGPFGKSNLNPIGKENGFVDELKSNSNVVLMGSVASADLPGYLQLFDILLLCYKASSPIELSNPHKMMEYLSTGKPIISHHVTEYETNQDLVYMAGSTNEFVALVNQITSSYSTFSSTDLSERRKKIALDNTYDSKLSMISKILRDYQLI